MNRKLKKLLESPDKFVRDAVDKRTWRLRARVPRPRTHTSRRFSVVTAVYNAAPYLQDFLTSLARQSVHFGESLELIAVDDGSSDDSLEILKNWESRHPGKIKVFSKPNGGQASARNVGIDHATGDWITFIDPDDFVAPDYFEHVDRILSTNEASDTTLVSCPLIFFLESTNSFRDNHPLRFRFSGGDRVIRDEQLDTHLLQLSAASGFFRRDIIDSSHLRFDEALRPVFEDAEFVARYLLTEPPRSIALCASATYFYRKRSDSSSTLDRAWQSPDRFTTLLRNAHLALLRRFPPHQAPLWLQRTVLYDLAWLFRRTINHSEHLAFLSPEELAEFRHLTSEILKHISPDTINNFDHCGIWLFHKLGWLALGGHAARPTPRAYIDGFDPEKNLFRLRHFYGDRSNEEIVYSDDDEADVVFEKTQQHEFAGSTFINERVLWIEPPTSNKRISFSLGKDPVQLILRKRKPSWTLVARDIIAGFHPAPRPQALPWYRRIEHATATSSLVSDHYRDCWLLMDRDTQADDNAEHLYRHIKNYRPDINAFFVLRQGSHDWPRLKREGFRLIAFGSALHRAALANAAHIVSSHIDRYVVDPMPDLTKASLRRFKITFLQHGVTKDDISNWLNPKKIDLLITASPREHQSIVCDGSPYRFSEHEVALTGFPRHDALGAVSDRGRTITLMPTWRLSLAGRVKGSGNERERNPDFAKSRFAQAWSSLLQSTELQHLSKIGHQIEFFPHANLTPYIHDLEIPPHISVKTHHDGSIQDVFRRTGILVTDYSSTAFELAYLQRAIVYFQFDRDEVFGGGHLTRPGYFDYDRDGFGPVCSDAGEVTKELLRLTSNEMKPAPEYTKRMFETFAFHDGNSCERVIQAIEALNSPLHPRARLQEIRIVRARRASAAGLWESATRRWSLVSAGPCGERELRLSEAHRELGHFVQSARILASLPGDTPESARERAKLLSHVHDWDAAIAAWRSELATADDDDRPLCALELGLALIARADHEEALSVLSPYCNATPTHARAVAEAAAALGDLHAAIDALTPWVDSVPKLRVQMSRYLAESGNVHRARELLESASVASEPEAERILVRYGAWR